MAKLRRFGVESTSARSDPSESCIQRSNNYNSVVHRHGSTLTPLRWHAADPAIVRVRARVP